MTPSAGNGPGLAVSPLAGELSSRIEALADPTVPALRGLRREVSRRLRDAPAGLAIGLALRLAGTGGIGHRLVGYELVRHHPEAPLRIRANQVAQLGRGIASWGAVDAFAVLVAGPAWRRRRLPDSRLRAWARSPDRWWRRAALVSTVALNSAAHGGTGDTRRTLAMCRRLARDRDPMVVKALSWALRELAKRDPPAVRAFIAANAGALAPRVLREVRNKLETGLKNPIRTRQRQPRLM
jgi:3-methyladenine DNA glycosylase AlkD